MITLKKVLYTLVGLGIAGFFVGSVMQAEFVYTLSACIAVWAGIGLVIRGRKQQPTKQG